MTIVIGFVVFYALDSKRVYAEISMLSFLFQVSPVYPTQILNRIDQNDVET